MRTIVSSMCGLLIVAGCSQKAPQPAPPATRADDAMPAPPPTTPPMPTTPPTPGDSNLPAIDPSPYSGPAAVVKALQLESFPVQCVASIEVTTPTGGWTLALDQAAVVGDTAKIFLTLEKPGEGEMVTQALVTHREQFKSTNPCFQHAEVYVHVAQRGVSTFTTNYRLAAKE